MKNIIIIGAGSVGGHVAYNKSNYGLSGNILGFLDDDPKKIGHEIFGLTVLGPVSDVIQMGNVDVVIGIAFPKTKRKILDLISSNESLRFPTLVSANAWVSEETSIGKGSIIYPGCSINYNSKIGDFVVMNLNCAIGHDTTIGNLSSLAPGVNTAGHTYIGQCVDVGIGVATKQSVRIGDNAIIGGQSMIVKNVAAGELVKGVPAR
jgi:sugar O-acyltransferase (sialic acid O-acetyltransferase NeuD family)